MYPPSEEAFGWQMKESWIGDLKIGKL